MKGRFEFWGDGAVLKYHDLNIKPGSACTIRTKGNILLLSLFFYYHYSFIIIIILLSLLFFYFNYLFINVFFFTFCFSVSFSFFLFLSLPLSLFLFLFFLFPFFSPPPHTPSPPTGNSIFIEEVTSKNEEGTSFSSGASSGENWTNKVFAHKDAGPVVEEKREAGDACDDDEWD